VVSAKTIVLATRQRVRKNDIWELVVGGKSVTGEMYAACVIRQQCHRSMVQLFQGSGVLLIAGASLMPELHVGNAIKWDALQDVASVHITLR
jgi:hypothetical protein